MEYLLMLGLMFTNIAISMGYNWAAKVNRGHETASFLFGACWMGAISALFAIVLVCTRNLQFSSFTTIWTGLVGGVTFGFSAYFYMKAMQVGPFTWSALAMNLSCFLPAIMSIVVLGEPFTLLTIVGLVIMAATVVVMGWSRQGENNGLSKRWVLYMVIFFLCNAVLLSMMKVQQTYVKDEMFQFIVVNFGAAAVTSLVLFFTKKGTVTGINAKGLIGPGAALAGLLSLNYLGNMALTRMVSGAMQFSLVTVGSIILTSVVGILFYKDKLTVKLFVCIAATVAGAFLIS